MVKEKKLHLAGVISHRSEASNHLRLPGDAVLVRRAVPRLLLIVCPCGCGEQLPINLDERAGPAWRLYRGDKGGLSLYPSVWRESGCESHFIIWRDRILLFGYNNQNAFDDFLLPEEGVPASESVLGLVREDAMMSYVDIAEALGAVPWDVLRICRKLARDGVIREGKGKGRGHFSK